MRQPRTTDECSRKTRQALTHYELRVFAGGEASAQEHWEVRQAPPPGYLIRTRQQLLFVERPVLQSSCDFTFIDLFAGIGGLRLAFEALGGRCVFTSERDPDCQKTYLANFACDHPLAGDITKIHAHHIPAHDVLLAGFPCQPFSIAGVSKKNALGRPHGFACEAQGTLFFDLARIISATQPRAFLLENVRNLLSHDRGRTFDVIRRTLEGELGYMIRYAVIDARWFVPQRRDRILIAGFREDTGFEWNALKLRANREQSPKLGSILHPEDGSEPPDGRYTSGPQGKVLSKYVLTDRLWQYLQEYARKHREKGNGFGYGLAGSGDVARTLSARYYKDGSEILVDRGARNNPRRLTPRECGRLMGFPDSFEIPVSDTQAYKQFGNSVVVPAIREAARLMKPHVMELVNRGRNGQP